jgi:hypothetical protein
VASSQLTRVLIDGGIGPNLLFVSILKKMGLDISRMFTPSKAPFYLLLKMSGKIGVLTFRGDLNKSYDCDQEAIKYTLIARMLEPSSKVFAAMQQLFQSTVKPNTSDIAVKTIQLQEGDSFKTTLISAVLDNK